ncbi:MAG: Clp protease N-terminal domain-containing protein [Cyanobacteria bacterium J06626_18]
MSFTKIYQNEGAKAASWGTTDAATFDYILKAVAFASLAEDMQLHFSEQNYTPAALGVMRLGQQAIRALNMDVFGTEAMLLGLIAEGSSFAAETLTTAGVTFEAIQHHIVAIVGARPNPSVEIPAPPHRPFAPASNESWSLHTNRQRRQVNLRARQNICFWASCKKRRKLKPQDIPPGWQHVCCEKGSASIWHTLSNNSNPPYRSSHIK